ncbi:hypothetical protein C8R43DRAFT_1131868 [Mycena crocata]|nr:hypothetical protein C8R43DRAFT_1131868 [Mycena crocata]
MHRRGGLQHPGPPSSDPSRYMEVPAGDPFQQQNPPGVLRGQSAHIGFGPPPAARSAALATPRANRDAVGGSMSLNLAHSYEDLALSNTPTQTNRYPGPNRAVHHLVPADNPSTNSQLERLVGMVQTLLQDNQELKQTTRELKEDNQELKERVASLESGAPGAARPSSRGFIARRGKATRPNARGRNPGRIGVDDSTDSDYEPANDTGGTDNIDLSPKERSSVQAFVTKEFRHHCHVGGNDWPDPTLIRTNPITHETYPTPFFQYEVSDLRNAQIICDVAYMAELVLKDIWPTVLKRSKSTQMPNWDQEFFVEMAKKSFRSLKRGWLREHNSETALRAQINARTHRRSQRRKSEQLLKVLLRFAEEYHIDLQFLKDIVHPEYLSDEMSGPEDETREAKAAWKVRLAAEMGISLSPDVLERTQILEVLSPPWRTDIVGCSPRDGPLLRVFTVPRYYAPYNFGFSQDWVKRNATNSEMRRMLKDWGNHSEPVDLTRLLAASRDGVENQGQ